MAALGSQSIASSYEQILQVDRDGGGDTTNHVSVKDGDNETTFGFTIASDALMMSSTNRLEFGDTGTYIHQSADGVLDLVSDTELELNATTIDINGAVDISGDVGIGVSPSYKLDILDSTTPQLNISNTASDNTAKFAHITCAHYDNEEQPITMVEGRSDGSNNYTRIGGGRTEGNACTNIEFYTTASHQTTAGTKRMNIDGDGAITAPAQPAFLVRPAASQDNIATNTVVTIVFGTEVFDQGGDFASNTFTAPVTGRYQLNANVRVSNLDSAADYYLLKIITSRRTYANVILDPDFGQDAAYWNFHNSVLANMDASDTAYVTLQQASGTAQTDIDTGDGETTFSGYLAC